MCSSWCTTTALARRIHRSLANRTCMGHDEAGPYSFSRACHDHCWVVATGARCLGHTIVGSHAAPSRLSACENTHLCCCQSGLDCELMWLLGHPLLWHVCFIWSQFIIIRARNSMHYQILKHACIHDYHMTKHAQWSRKIIKICSIKIQFYITLYFYFNLQRCTTTNICKLF